MTYHLDTPLTGRQSGQRVQTIQLQVDTLPGNRLRISTPMARGWARTAATASELARAVHAAFLEVSVAGYARAHGEPYDLDALTGHQPGDPLANAKPRQVRNRRNGRKPYNPQDWTPQPDGTWRSPGGRLYRADSTAVQNVIKKRDDYGLAASALPPTG